MDAAEVNWSSSAYPFIVCPSCQILIVKIDHKDFYENI